MPLVGARLGTWFQYPSNRVVDRSSRSPEVGLELSAFQYPSNRVVDRSVIGVVQFGGLTGFSTLQIGSLIEAPRRVERVSMETRFSTLQIGSLIEATPAVTPASTVSKFQYPSNRVVDRSLCHVISFR